MRTKFVLVTVCLCSFLSCEAKHDNDSTSAKFAEIVDSLTGRINALEARIGELDAAIAELNYPYIPEEISFAGERVPLEKWWVREGVEDALKLYIGRRDMRRRVAGWLFAAEQHFPYIDRVLEERGLPQDLRYVPVIESEFNHRAASSAGAIGAWQIMRGTGKEAGLRIDGAVDERKHFERATEAALKKLEEWRGEFGDWFLALAAYNAGSANVWRAIAEDRDSSYFNLDALPEETKRYVFGAIAVKLIFENPSRYYFRDEAKLHVVVKTIFYRVAKPAKLSEIARALGIPPREFRLLNPQFVGKEIPRGLYELRVPRDLEYEK